VPLVQTLPGIAKDTDGKPLASPELVVVVNLEKREGGSSNVTIRGVGEKAAKLRPTFNLEKGRMFVPGKSEVIVSRSVERRFANCDVGQTIRFGAYRWTVVGLFDAGGTAPDSEIWTDVEGMASDFKRNGYSSVLARTTDRAGRDQFLAGLAGTRASPSRERSSGSTTTTRPPRRRRSSSWASSSASSWRSAPASAP